MNLLSNAIDALDESNASRTYADIDKHPNIITVCTEVKDAKEEGKKEGGRRKREEGRRKSGEN